MSYDVGIEITAAVHARISGLLTELVEQHGLEPGPALMDTVEGWLAEPMNLDDMS